MMNSHSSPEVRTKPEPTRSNPPGPAWQRPLGFRSFELVSDFEIRISGFPQLERTAAAALSSFMRNEPNFPGEQNWVKFLLSITLGAIRPVGPRSRRTQSKPIFRPETGDRRPEDGRRTKDDRERRTDDGRNRQIRIRQTSETLLARQTGVSDLGFRCFGLFSHFDIRISSFPHPSRVLADNSGAKIAAGRYNGGPADMGNWGLRPSEAMTERRNRRTILEGSTE